MFNFYTNIIGTIRLTIANMDVNDTVHESYNAGTCMTKAKLMWCVVSLTQFNWDVEFYSFRSIPFFMIYELYWVLKLKILLFYAS